MERLARGVIAAGFDGETFDATLPAFGAYVLFARNVSSMPQVRALADALRSRTDDGVAPLIAIDQEGGRVARIAHGVEPMPSMMALGAANDLELAGRAGEQVAFDLRRAGCSLNFAPVLDLAVHAGNTVIGTRSLGADPEAVSALGSAFAARMQRGGMLPCYKHFPGHGATAGDSHASLPVVEADEAAWRTRDLIPFAAVAPTAPAMMGAHLVATAFDAENPGTTSRRVAVELLRGQLKFAGVFITDCLEMSALGDDLTPERAVAALSAGADLLTVSHSVAFGLQIVEAIVKAVRDGTLAASRLEEAYARVLRLRQTAGDPLPLDDVAPHPGVGREIARRAVTLVRGFAHADPLSTIVVSFEGEAFVDGINVSAPAFGSLRHEAPALSELRLPLDPTLAQVAVAKAALGESGRRPLLLARSAHLHASQVDAIDALIAGFPDALVTSMLEPFDVPLFSAARHVLANYGDDPAAIGGLADVLFGGTMPQGTLPVSLPSNRV